VEKIPDNIGLRVLTYPATRVLFVVSGKTDPSESESVMYEVFDPRTGSVVFTCRDKDRAITLARRGGWDHEYVGRHRTTKTKGLRLDAMWDGVM
jgi:hypothetical protein